MKQCPACGREFTNEEQQTRRGLGKFCSLGCRIYPQGQEKPRRGRPKSAGGKRFVTSTGYIGVTVSRDQHSGGFVLEHRMVMETIMGRALRSNEHVHHVDGNKRNNDPSNLLVVTNSQHHALHDVERSAIALSKRIELVCETCGLAYNRPKNRAEESRYCSNACRLVGLHQKSKAFHASRRPDPIICQQCGESFQVKAYRVGEAKYCSKACADVAKQLDNPEKACERCGVMFRKRYRSETAKARFCSETCACRTMTELRLAG